MSRNGTKRIFLAGISLVLLIGYRQLFADPTRFGNLERSPVIINEFLAAESTQSLDSESDEDFDVAEGQLGAGWIELYNRGSQPVDLSNWTLTDEAAAPDKWRFPPVTIDPGSYLLIWSKNADIPPPEVLNSVEPGAGDPESGKLVIANVQLEPNGGFLALYPPTVRRFADSPTISYPPQVTNSSYGRPDHNQSRFSYLTQATPGKSNDGDVLWAGMTSLVIASAERGFYFEPFSVSLRTETVDAEIRYTLDGTTPSAEHGKLYSDELLITNTTLLRAVALKDGWRSGAVVSHSYIFPEEVIRQPQDPSSVSKIEWPEHWGSHRITLFGFDKGDPVLADYEMDPKITQDPAYEQKMVDSLLALPSISLVTDMENLDIYFEDPQMRGLQSERPASVEFLYPDEAGRNFQVGTGLRIQGGAGRWEYMPKHSFRLFFKQKYGATRLHHKVFDDSRLTSFNTLVLRGGVGRSFAGHPNTVDQPDVHNDHHATTYARDEWARETEIALSGVGSHGTFMHLYLNGLYWGLYNIVERPDRVFASDYYGGDVESWFTASHGGAGDGQPDRFVVMMQLAEAGGLADPAKYATMLEFIDPVHFSDYMILNWAMGNRDWPENNWYINVDYPAGRNIFSVWDAENTWNVGAEMRIGGTPKEGAPFPNVAKLLFDALMENEEYRLLLADRLSRHLRNGGLLTATPSQERWRAITEPLQTAIIAESARWGDTRYAEPITLADWIAANESVLSQMEGNGARLLQQAREAGYYPAVEPPVFSQHGGVFDQQLLLEIEADGGGDIWYTLDGSDPREAGAHHYEGPITIDTAATLKARQLVDGVWSALTEARFRRADQHSDVRITEIMYHPLDGSVHGDPERASERYEFIEVRNVGEDDIDLSFAYFEGVTHIFPAYTTMRAGEAMVLIKDFKAFRQRYPTADFHGIYRGKLSDGGETLALRDVNGNVITSVTYNDGNGWPLSADGTGDSLVLVDFGGSPDQPESWGVSSEIHGSPGQ